MKLFDAIRQMPETCARSEAINGHAINDLIFLDDRYAPTVTFAKVLTSNGVRACVTH
jgi:hypothetical protein